MTRSITPDNNKKGLKLWAVLLWLALWQCAGLWVGQELLLATPLAVVKSLCALVGQGGFWRAVGFSLSRIALGFFLAAIFAAVLGVWAAKRPVVRQLIAPLLTVIKATPVASFIIVVLIWVPSRNLSVLISFLMVFPVLYLNVCGTVGQLNGALREMALLFGVPAKKRLRYLYLPELLPHFRSACSVALGLCWKAGVAAEVIGIPSGSLGEKLYQAKIYLKTPELFAWTVVIIALSVCMEKLVLWGLDAASEKWGRM